MRIAPNNGFLIHQHIVVIEVNEKHSKWIPMTNRIEKAITIYADPATIWKALTQPALMEQWMGGPEMDIKIYTDWKINKPISINGFHHIQFENKGIVLHYERNSRLTYTHLSSVSGLADKPDNYSTIEFILTSVEKQTILTLTIDNFPTESIFKHLDFYWRNTIPLIKRLVEKQTKPGL